MQGDVADGILRPFLHQVTRFTHVSSKVNKLKQKFSALNSHDHDMHNLNRFLSRALPVHKLPFHS